MGFFKRLGLFLYALAGVFCLASLGLYVFRTPYYHTVAGFMEYPWYRVAVVATMAITALGCLICLLRALFAPRKRKEVVVSKDGQDTVTVATSAITSQASHIIERAGGLTADRVSVDVKRGDQVQVKVRVRPHNAVNVVEEGTRLRDELSTGLATICGDRISGIDLQFVESDSAESAEFVEQGEHVPATNVHVEVPGEPHEDVTVPMGASIDDTFGGDEAQGELDGQNEEETVLGYDSLFGESEDGAEE